jgi:hypothetical protein
MSSLPAPSAKLGQSRAGAPSQRLMAKGTDHERGRAISLSEKARRGTSGPSHRSSSPVSFPILLWGLRPGGGTDLKPS